MSRLPIPLRYSRLSVSRLAGNDHHLREVRIVVFPSSRNPAHEHSRRPLRRKGCILGVFNGTMHHSRSRSSNRNRNPYPMLPSRNRQSERTLIKLVSIQTMLHNRSLPGEPPLGRLRLRLRQRLRAEIAEVRTPPHLVSRIRLRLVRQSR